MANAKYDFAVGKYFLVEIGDDGPSRLEGHTTYSTPKAARDAAERYMRSGRRGCRVTVCRVEGTYWLDPKPEVLSDLPQVELTE